MESLDYLLFADVNISAKTDEGREVRKLLSIDRSEATMLTQKLNIQNVLDLIFAYKQHLK